MANAIDGQKGDDSLGNLHEWKAGGERADIDRLMGHLLGGVVPTSELHANLPLFLRRQELSRILFIARLYEEIVPLHGYIMEFGCRYGANLAMFSALRGMHEPYNFSRKLIGFDTFSGFAGVDSKKDVDQKIGSWSEGDYSVPDNHQAVLTDILETHDRFSPISHVKKFELVKGDVSVTLPQFLERQPETLVALAYFDMDIYKPTKDALAALKPRLQKGSILVFDELCCEAFPGETSAVLEELDVSKHRFLRDPHQPYCSYTVIE